MIFGRPIPAPDLAGAFNTIHRQTLNNKEVNEKTHESYFLIVSPASRFLGLKSHIVGARFGFSQEKI